MYLCVSVRTCIRFRTERNWCCPPNTNTSCDFVELSAIHNDLMQFALAVQWRKKRGRKTRPSGREKDLAYTGGGDWLANVLMFVCAREFGRSSSTQTCANAPLTMHATSEQALLPLKSLNPHALASTRRRRHRLDHVRPNAPATRQ